MIPRNRPVRVAAAVGATLAAGAVAMLAATTTASADEPGRCVQNVNIREEPDVDSRIVALCEAGTQVKLGAERDGWVRIDDLGGWASKEFVKADESAFSSDASDDDHGTSGDRGGADEHHSSSDGDHSDGDHSDGSGADRSGGDDSGEAGAGDSAAGDRGAGDRGAGSGGRQLGGLLG